MYSLRRRGEVIVFVSAIALMFQRKPELRRESDI